MRDILEGRDSGRSISPRFDVEALFAASPPALSPSATRPSSPIVSARDTVLLSDARLRRETEDGLFRAHEAAYTAIKVAAEIVPKAAIAKMEPLLRYERDRAEHAPSPDPAAAIALIHRGTSRELTALSLVHQSYLCCVSAHRIMNKYRERMGYAPVPFYDKMPPERAAFDRLIASREPAIVAVPTEPAGDATRRPRSRNEADEAPARSGKKARPA